MVLLLVVMFISYFSPNYDCFNNIEMFGSQPPVSTEVEVIKDYSGNIVNGYQPFIIRPNDTTSYQKRTDNGTLCSWPMFDGNNNKQKWCNEENAIKYHAMRPLKTPKTYNQWLEQLFTIITNPGNSVTKLLESKLYPKVYCSSGSLYDGLDEKKVIMSWLMKKVAVGVNKIPAMKKNSTWGNEQFHYTDAELYAFTTNPKGYTTPQDTDVFKILFNLYNPLRSTSTMVEAVVVSPYRPPNVSSQYILAKMGFVSQGEWDETKIKGYDLPRSNGDIGIEINQVTSTDPFGWNYGNTLSIQEFNKYGFFDPGNNVTIEGGVPESLKKALQQHNNKMLLEPVSVDFKGFSGQPKLVDSTKAYIYDVPPSSKDPKIISI